jgi:hypothetical protein
MHKNPFIDIRRPMPEIKEFSGLADLGRVLRFVQDSKEMFREVEISRTASVCSQIMSIAGPDKVLVITCSSRQVLGISLTLEVIE